MTIYLKQSTASQEVALGFFVDSTDGNTEETGLTIAAADIRLHKAGGTTLTTPAAGATHISNGIYYWVADATDTGTLGPLVIYCHPTGALAVRVECCVLAANVYDSLIGGGDILDVSMTQILGTAVATPSVAGVLEVDLTHVAGATTDVSALATNVAAILVDTGTTLDARIPAALVGGRMDASLGAIAAGVDLSATMKTSVTTAATAATPIAASVTGAVGSVTGNVGGNVVGSVASVTAGVTLSTSTMTEAYAADGAAMSAPQALYMIWSKMAEMSISGTTLTAKKLDGSTTAMTFTLDSATTPAAITRAT